MSDSVVGATSPLDTRKSPLAAGLLGVCLGPLGTLVTPGTKGDLLVTGSVYAVSALAWGGHGMMLGLLFAGVYGAARVARSNARIDAAERAAARAAAARPPLLLEAVSVVVARPADSEPSPAIDAAASVVLVDLEPEARSEPRVPVAEGEPPSPPVPPTPRKRGRPKGSRKLAA